MSEIGHRRPTAVAAKDNRELWARDLDDRRGHPLRPLPWGPLSPAIEEARVAWLERQAKR